MQTLSCIERYKSTYPAIPPFFCLDDDEFSIINCIDSVRNFERSSVAVKERSESSISDKLVLEG